MSLMIDWLSFTVPIIHSQPINDGNVLSVTPEGDISWKIDKKMLVEGSHGSSFQVRSEQQTFFDGEHYSSAYTIIRFDGNPIKFMQGHNVFGSSDIQGLLYSCVYRILSLSSPILLEEVNSRLHLYCHLADLTRVDITGMYDLGTDDRVLNWLRSAADSAHLRHRGRGQFAGDTLYWGKNSRRWSLKFYPKNQELKAHKPRKGIVDHPQYLRSIQEYASGTLRVELVLRGMELRERGLDSVQCWHDNTPADTFMDYLSGLEFSQNMKVSSGINIEGLEPRLVGPLHMWQSGLDLRSYFSKSSFYRYRSDLKKAIGIDISLPPPIIESNNIIPLFVPLEAKPKPIPNWAYGTDLLFEPPAYPRLFAV